MYKTIYTVLKGAYDKKKKERELHNTQVFIHRKQSHKHIPKCYIESLEKLIVYLMFWALHCVIHLLLKIIKV